MKIRYVTQACTLAVLAISMVLAGPAAAEQSDLLDTLLVNGVITKEQYQRLVDEQNGNVVEEPVFSEEAAETVVVTSRGGLRGISSDGQFSYELGGRIVADFAVYDNDLVEMGSGSKLRRVRFDVEGGAWTDWGYKIELDLAEDEVEVKDTYIQYEGFDNLRLRLGHLKEPFSLEEQTTSVFNTFMERALPNALVPQRNVGVTFLSSGKHWSLGGGVFGEGLDDLNGDDEIDEGIGGSARLTVTPIERERANLHFGVSAAYRKTGDDKRVRVRARPESNLTSIRFVNTGRIADVEDHSTYGVEAAAVVGPFSVQGEYITKELRLIDDITTYEFDGYYAFVSLFLTGESRDFRNSVGEFGRTRPRSIVGNGGIGAWEVALRYSNIDLTDDAFDGGVEDNITFALNWYPTPNIRFMLNIATVDALRRGESNAPDIYQLRAQFDF